MQVSPSGGQICDQCKWRHLVAKLATNSSSTTEIKFSSLLKLWTQYSLFVVPLALFENFVLNCGGWGSRVFKFLVKIHHHTYKKSIKRLKQPTSVFLQEDVGHVRSSSQKQRKTRKTKRKNRKGIRTMRTKI